MFNQVRSKLNKRFDRIGNRGGVARPGKWAGWFCLLVFVVWGILVSCIGGHALKRKNC